MISCTEFIPLYSELFKYLDHIGGKENVLRYWEHISDTYVADRLGSEVKQNGIHGCWNYWKRSLNEEACDFKMTLDEEAKVFSIDMRKCPSRSMLNRLSYTDPYPDYCEHCAVLYSRVLSKYGIMQLCDDRSHTDQAACFLSFGVKSADQTEK